jgi:hypothetical protein
MHPRSAGSVDTTRFSRLLREPTLHFFVLAAGALLVHRLIVGDPHTIELTPALRADLARRYQDQLGRPLTSAEIEASVAAWKTDEVLYREALRQGMDRDDPTVRNLLITNLRERLMQQARLREPTEAELQQFLEQHRADYELPLIYEHEFVAWAKQAPGAEHERAKYERLLTAGATPASLGLRSTAANVDRQRIERELGPEVAEKIPHLPVGQWQELETGDRLLLVKLIRIQGGLAEPAVLHQQLLAGFQAAVGQKALEQATEALVRRYRFDERPR